MYFLSSLFLNTIIYSRIVRCFCSTDTSIRLKLKRTFLRGRNINSVVLMTKPFQEVRHNVNVEPSKFHIWYTYTRVIITHIVIDRRLFMSVAQLLLRKWIMEWYFIRNISKCVNHSWINSDSFRWYSHDAILKWGHFIFQSFHFLLMLIGLSLVLMKTYIILR